MRFHLLGVPHTISTPEYSACAFTGKVVKMAKMLRSRGHHVIHYGHEHSRVDCDEHVTVTTADDLHQAYGDHDWRVKGFPDYKLEDAAYQAFHRNAIRELGYRGQKGDFLLCPFGHAHKPEADAYPGLIAVESGIGYSGGSFAKFRVFESYAIMHVYQGQQRLASMSNEMWYDWVIPNSFDLVDFEYSADKENYFLHLGRIGPGKGTHIAVEVANAIGAKLVIAGPGAMSSTDNIEVVGVVGPERRKQLMRDAKGTFCPSMYLEPFCGVQIESMLSGTPVISTDWGAFVEYNPHGVTGYRCRTMEQFTWAARNIDQIAPIACRRWAEKNFSLDHVAGMYDEFFWSVAQVHGGKGWYEVRPGRRELNWLRQHHPLEWH